MDGGESSLAPFIQADRLSQVTPGTRQARGGKELQEFIQSPTCRAAGLQWDSSGGLGREVVRWQQPSEANW